MHAVTEITQPPPEGEVRSTIGFERALWLLPVFGALTLWATFSHQPSPTTAFDSWASFVTSGDFVAKHLVGSILGLALNTVGVAALSLVAIASGRQLQAAAWGFVLTVIGSAGLLAGFGVAAFAQPAIGDLELAQYSSAHEVYDSVYSLPAYVTLIGGAALFSLATILLARAARAINGVPRWARIAYGASGPLIGIVGVAIGVAQTVGSIAAIAGGAAVAVSAHRRAGSSDPESIRR
jgi:hypothetical protein